MTTSQILSDALTYGFSVIDETIPLLDGFPNLTEKGVWQTTKNGGWTGGFWPGLLWIGFTLTGKDRYVEEALRWVERLQDRATDASTHDLGFLFFPSCVHGFHLTEDNRLLETALLAAATLRDRFHEAGQLIPEKGLPGEAGYGSKTLVDTMMNLGLLFWASEQTGDQSYADRAIRHAQTCSRYHVRSDGFTAQGFLFDATTGQPIGETTDHGHASDSRWARGLAWALYGFTTTYQATGQEVFLDMARRCSNAFCSHLPDDYVPYWDYDAPGQPNAVRDSSAASAAASGLLDLGVCDPNPNQGRLYHRWALRILNSLANRYTTRGLTDQGGILHHATRSVPLDSGIDGALIYGDYYFMEALVKATRPGIWLRMAGQPDA